MAADGGDTAARGLSFWLGEADPDLAADGTPRKEWFVADPAFDTAIRDAFAGDVGRAARGELDGLAESARGALALVVLLDQFPRNLNRGSPEAVATDATALEVAETAIGRGFDAELGLHRRMFLYLPLEHAEDIDAQIRSVELFRAMGDEGYYRYALEHHYVISRFGRFPTRNKALGRADTAEEAAFLAGFDAF